MYAERMLWRTFVLLLIPLLGGCAELRYYTHAAGGQLEVVGARKPIDAVLADPLTPPRTRQQLQLLGDAREFAINRLDLPDSATFRDYADLGRPWVLWNVFAAAPLSLQPRKWCYPGIGCQSYRSFFDAAYANEFAQQLRDAGLDVYVAPSPAYSTRGWFADPVYAPMLRYDDTTLVGMLFHELAHERVYFASDSELNESFAMAVQYAGLQQWLAEIGKPQQFADYQREQRHDRDFALLVLDYRDRLQTLYDSDAGDSFKLAEKRRLFSSLRRDYWRLKPTWQGDADYDGWFDKPLNNARLLPIATYHGFVGAFRQLLAMHHNDWPGFYAEVERLAALPVEQRRQALQQRLADQGLHRYSGTIASSAVAAPKRAGNPSSQTLSTVSDR